MSTTQARVKPRRTASRAMRPVSDPPLRCPAGTERSAPGARVCVGTARRLVHVIACALVLALVTRPARATQPFIWDQDTNGIDDRIESVHALGWSASFELSDTTLRQRIAVVRALPELLYEVYVRWDHTPTSSDVTSLTLLGMPVLGRIEAVPASRSLATFAQVS